MLSLDPLIDAPVFGGTRLPPADRRDPIVGRRVASDWSHFTHMRDRNLYRRVHG
jgi:hypothetical protein